MRELDRGREIPVSLRRPRAAGVPPRREPAQRGRLWRWLLPRRLLDAVAVLVAVAATGGVLVNALVLQDVPHPAPMFAEPAQKGSAALQEFAMRRLPGATAPTTEAVETAPAPPPRPEAAEPVPAAREGIVLDIQRELTTRGYYTGPLDGLFGPRTAQAIRDFETAEGLAITGEPNISLLGRILQARNKTEVTGSVTQTEPKPAARVLAVQRVLARLGYGPVRLNGEYDAQTRAAIERFERDRGLAAKGEISNKLLSEITAVTGAPVE